jgi:uncharacterized membrane protein
MIRYYIDCSKYETQKSNFDFWDRLYDKNIGKIENIIKRSFSTILIFELFLLFTMKKM